MVGPRPQPARPRAPEHQNREWRFIETTSDLAGQADNGLQGMMQHNAFKDLPRAAAVSKRLGLIGTGLSIAEAQQAYMRNLKIMSPDEAFIASFGAAGVEAAGGTAGALLGGAGGSVVGGPLGGVAGGIGGGMLGERAAKPLADGLLPAYRAGKSRAERTVENARALAERLAQYNEPSFYARRYPLYRYD